MGASNPHANPKNAPSIKRGVEKRVGGDVPEPDPVIMKEFGRYVERWLIDHIVPLGLEDLFTFEQWLDTSHYTFARKEQLREAKLELDTISEPDKDKYVKVIQAFQKIERYTKYKDPRGIYSRSDMFKCYCGPLFKSIERKIYEIKTSTRDAVDENGSYTFVKHIPVSERAAHVVDKLRGNGRKYMATDYTAYEKHFTKELMEICEFKMYRHMLRNLPEEGLIMEHIINVLCGKNKIRFRDFIVYVSACRMSGEMNTSLGNGFANLMAYHFIHHRLGNTQVDGVFEGDDGLGCYDGVSPTEQDYLNLGLTCKILLVEKVSEASFCGLIFDEQCMISITDPIKALLNLGWSNYYYVGGGPKCRKQLLKSKLLSMAHQYRGVPILQEAAYKLLTFIHPDLKPIHASLSRYYDSQLLEIMKGPLPDPIPVDMRTRLVMEKEFGVTVREQLILEQKFRNMTKLPESYTDPIIIAHATDDMVWYYSNYSSGYRKLKFGVQ